MHRHRAGPPSTTHCARQRGRCDLGPVREAPAMLARGSIAIPQSTSSSALLTLISFSDLHSRGHLASVAPFRWENATERHRGRPPDINPRPIPSVPFAGRPPWQRRPIDRQQNLGHPQLGGSPHHAALGAGLPRTRWAGSRGTVNGMLRAPRTAAAAGNDVLIMGKVNGAYVNIKAPRGDTLNHLSFVAVYGPKH